ncbi:DUF5366 family protein [Bacillus sp. CGMCC 1.16607]|uniref:DUF5366 family protein n=1 Tax=Bacillus sp. CGMCC 1.16607 TaxID=3351842 RepID=UPI003631B42A
MKNTYLTSYFPLLSLLLLSLSFAVSFEFKLIDVLKDIGIYNGMLEFFSDSGIKLSLLTLLTILFFMVLSALKIIADTINELSLLFFSKETEGQSLTKIRSGSGIYFFASGVSLLVSFYSLIGVLVIFLIATFGYFIFIVYKISAELTVVGMAGLVFFQVIVWSTLLIGVAYLVVKVYNSVLASLPI